MPQRRLFGECSIQIAGSESLCRNYWYWYLGGRQETSRQPWRSLSIPGEASKDNAKSNKRFCWRRWHVRCSSRKLCWYVLKKMKCNMQKKCEISTLFLLSTVSMDGGVFLLAKELSKDSSLRSMQILRQKDGSLTGNSSSQVCNSAYSVEAVSRMNVLPTERSGEQTMFAPTHAAALAFGTVQNDGITQHVDAHFSSSRFELQPPLPSRNGLNQIERGGFPPSLAQRQHMYEYASSNGNVARHSRSSFISPEIHGGHQIRHDNAQMFGLDLGSRSALQYLQMLQYQHQFQQQQLGQDLNMLFQTQFSDILPSQQPSYYGCLPPSTGTGFHLPDLRHLPSQRGPGSLLASLQAQPQAIGNAEGRGMIGNGVLPRGDPRLPTVERSQMVNPSATSSVPDDSPIGRRILASEVDQRVLSKHQQFLRQQIEIFKATTEDVCTHTRGRNKTIKHGQVGIRCRHCAHVPLMRRQKGSSYYPSSVRGFYQAAQNMNTTHLQCGLCNEAPTSIKDKFAELLAYKNANSGAGRAYWAESARHMGLVDTDDGIFFRSDLSAGSVTLNDSMPNKKYS